MRYFSFTLEIRCVITATAGSGAVFNNTSFSKNSVTLCKKQEEHFEQHQCFCIGLTGLLWRPCYQYCCIYCRCCVFVGHVPQIRNFTFFCLSKLPVSSPDFSVKILFPLSQFLKCLAILSTFIDHFYFRSDFEIRQLVSLRA